MDEKLDFYIETMRDLIRISYVVLNDNIIHICDQHNSPADTFYV